MTMDKDAVGATGAPSTLEVERGKIAVFARATLGADPAYFRPEGAVVPPTFLTTILFWETLVDGANPWERLKMDQRRGMHAEQEYEFHDFFYLPPVDDAYGKPFLVAGDLVAMFNDRPEVRALMEYFTTPQSTRGWLEGGGAIAAHQTATRDLYGSDLDWGVSELVAQATSFRFDGSDLKPGEVGAGSFWEQISSYVAGSSDLDTATKEIDATWPE